MLIFETDWYFVGEQSEPPSDKIGGEMFISSRACMFVTIHIYGGVRPDNQYHANSPGSYASRRN